MSVDMRLLVIAACCLVATIALGAYVAHRPLVPLDVASIALRGRNVDLAIAFTRSGYWPVLSAIVVVVGAIEVVLNRSVLFTAVLGAMQLLSQLAANGIKDIFKRIRPDDWLYHQELGFSYPSGHATTAVVFFGGLLLFVWNQPLPRAVQIVASLAVGIWMIGIPWSRMALAAHYGTDVLGGLLLGGSALALTIVLLRHMPAAHMFV